MISVPSWRGSLSTSGTRATVHCTLAWPQQTRDDEFALRPFGPCPEVGPVTQAAHDIGVVGHLAPRDNELRRRHALLGQNRAQLLFAAGVASLAREQRIGGGVLDAQLARFLAAPVACVLANVDLRLGDELEGEEVGIAHLAALLAGAVQQHRRDPLRDEQRDCHGEQHLSEQALGQHGSDRFRHHSASAATRRTSAAKR